MEPLLGEGVEDIFCLKSNIKGHRFHHLGTLAKSTWSRLIQANLAKVHCNALVVIFMAFGLGIKKKYILNPDDAFSLCLGSLISIFNCFNVLWPYCVFQHEHCKHQIVTILAYIYISSQQNKSKYKKFEALYLGSVLHFRDVMYPTIGN